MAKKLSDKERAIAFFTTANEADVITMLETVNTIARARGFNVGGRKRKAATSTPAAPSRRRGQGPGQSGKDAADAAAKKAGETEQQSAAAAGS